MNTIFIYYSFTGNGDVVAEELSRSGITIRKVEAKHSLPKLFFLKMMVGGFLTLLHRHARLVNFDSDVSDYGRVVIGSPIWDKRLSTPINTVLSKLNLKNKEVTFILYSASGKSPKATKTIERRFPNARIINLKEPIINEHELEKLERELDR